MLCSCRVRCHCYVPLLTDNAKTISPHLRRKDTNNPHSRSQVSSTLRIHLYSRHPYPHLPVARFRMSNSHWNPHVGVGVIIPLMRGKTLLHKHGQLGNGRLNLSRRHLAVPCQFLDTSDQKIRFSQNEKRIYVKCIWICHMITACWLSPFAVRNLNIAA